MSARPSLDNSQQLDARNGPVPHFDRHLSVLKNGYLYFFSERIRIEGQYIEELKALYKRIKQQDQSLDIGMEYSQARAAWREIRESLDREIQSRTAFCTAVNTDVIRPLRELRDTQERTRQRIHEDMKESQSAYTECADSQLPRAHKHYRRKCQEAEESRMAPAIPMPPNQHASNNSISGQPLFSPNQEAFSPPPSYANLHSPEATNHASGQKPGPPTPTPNAAANTSSTGLANTTSRGDGPERARSPPPAQAGPRAAIQDFTQSSKKGLSQLKSFLDNKRDGGGSLREGSERGNSALRNVRARREADEADKEYRRVVYKLETLRRWRGNVIRAGFTSLETFMVDLSHDVIKALQKYNDALIATATTNTQMATQSQSLISHVNPEREVLAAHQLIPEHISRVLPKRTLYQNYTYGDSFDLIFGFSLLDYAAARNLEEGGVPGLVAKAVRAVDERGLDSEGIYRISGRQAIVQDLIHRIEKDETQFEFEKTTDVFCIGSLLKRYLRELPEPLFKFPLAERLQHSAGRSEHIKNGFMMLRGKLRRLPGVHQSTMRIVIEHLARVAARSQKNKMDARNLSIVFSGVIFGEDEIPKGSTDLLSVGTMKDTVMEDLINYAPMLFDENAHTRMEGASPSSSVFFYANAMSGTDELPDYTASTSILVGPEKGEKAGSTSGHSTRPSIHESQDTHHPDEKEKEKDIGKLGKEKEKELDSALIVRQLPPEPVGELPAKIDYGSSHTVIRVGDAPPNFSPTLPEVDFAPRLPPRPGKSIHPSSRAAALNPERSQEGAAVGNGPPPALPPRAGSGEVPTLPPRRLGSGVPALDVRLPSPLPEMTFPRTPSPTPRTPVSEVREEEPGSPLRGRTSSAANTPVKTTFPGVSTPTKTSNSQLRTVEKSPEGLTDDSPATAEFTTPVPSPMGTRVTPSRVVAIEDTKDTSSPRRSAEAAKEHA
ncbi:Rho GTPase-activating protein gacY [Rhizoctonia solani]|uniref:Rho GTPase-activating protein gacY n=1 Tax=Rhizoctonia solani TaxID=456999 RepID=A0A0K6G1K8_9AGAM|nr:Rho GTPase-activating protein gacY [Rhizoctonia solani]